MRNRNFVSEKHISKIVRQCLNEAIVDSEYDVIVRNAKKAAMRDGYDQAITFNEDEGTHAFHRKRSGETIGESDWNGDKTVAIVRLKWKGGMPYADIVEL